MTSLRFVLLEHDHPSLHWDLMLEETDGLRSWRLPSPSIGIEAMEAEALPKHRAAYLEYEGPVSGNRGAVRRCDAGTYRVLGGWEEGEGLLELRGARRSVKTRWRREGERWIFFP